MGEVWSHAARSSRGRLGWGFGGGANTIWTALCFCSSLPNTRRGASGPRENALIPHDSSPQIPHPPGLSPPRVLLPVAVSQYLLFLVPLQGLCLSVILPPIRGLGRWELLSPLLTSSRLLASPSSAQSLEATLALPRNIQLLRFCRTSGAGCGAHSLGL